MIVDIVLTIITWFLKALNSILPTYSVYPGQLLEGLKYFFSQMMVLNNLFPMDTILNCMSLFSTILFWFFTAKIVIICLGYIRGTNSM